MCIAYSNQLEINGRIVKKSSIRISERLERFRESLKTQFYHTNGYGHERLPVLTQAQPDEWQFMRWGLIPRHTRDETAALQIESMTLNAASETIFEKPSFRRPIRSQRCLVPATGFFEWHLHNGKDKIPYHIMIREGEGSKQMRPFCFGGIYDSWLDMNSGDTIDTFSIITTPANEVVSRIHNVKKRMPLVIAQEDEEKWLDPKLSETGISSLLRTYPSDLTFGYTVSRRLADSSAPVNVPELLHPFDYRLSSVAVTVPELQR